MFFHSFPFSYSHFHSLIPSHPHPFHPFIHSLSFPHPPSFIPSFPLSPTPHFIQSLSYPQPPSFLPSHSHPHPTSSIHSFILSFTHNFLPPFFPTFLPSLLPSLPLPPARQPPPGQARRHRPSTFTPRRHRSPSNRRLAATSDKAQYAVEAWRTA